MGCSRGGLTTKIHALCDTIGLPLGLKLTEGQAHDGRSAAGMLDGIGAGQNLRAAWANVARMPTRKRWPAFSPFLYRHRTPVERFFNKLKHFRPIATRYDKEPENHLAGVKLASARIWIRTNASVANCWILRSRESYTAESPFEAFTNTQMARSRSTKQSLRGAKIIPDVPLNWRW